MMTGSAHPLDVFLRDSRDYVQGTQIIARLAEATAGGTVSLGSASFSRISDRLLLSKMRSDVSATDAVVGYVSFDVDGSDYQVAVIETEHDAPRLDRDMQISIALARQTAPLAALYSFSGARDFEAILNVIVQTTKNLHEKLNDSVSDVWFSGARGLPLPLRWQVETGHVSIRSVRLMRRDSQYQSLLHVSVLDADHEPVVSGHITFAFKSDEVVHVD